MGKQDLKFCVDCRFHGWTAFEEVKHWCHHNMKNEYNLVTGHLSSIPSSCDQNRKDPLACGASGNWFEPKKEVI